MTETETETTDHAILTKELLAALKDKRNTNLVFLIPSGGDPQTAQVKVCTDTRIRGAHREVEAYYPIYGAVQAYDYTELTAADSRAVFLISRYHSPDVVDLLFRTMRVGDRVQFTARTNQSGCLNDAGLAKDELTVTVYRDKPDKFGGFQRKVIAKNIVIDTEITPFNSTARGIRPA